jgi:hypothetical protein
MVFAQRFVSSFAAAGIIRNEMTITEIITANRIDAAIVFHGEEFFFIEDQPLRMKTNE